MEWELHTIKLQLAIKYVEEQMVFCFPFGKKVLTVSNFLHYNLYFMIVFKLQKLIQTENLRLIQKHGAYTIQIRLNSIYMWSLVLSALVQIVHANTMYIGNEDLVGNISI